MGAFEFPLLSENDDEPCWDIWTKIVCRDILPFLSPVLSLHTLDSTVPKTPQIPAFSPLHLSTLGHQALSLNRLPSTRHIPNRPIGIIMRIRNAIVLHALAHVLRHILPVDLAHKRIGRIDAGRDAAGGDDVAVFDPASRWHPGHVGACGGSPRPAAFVCCGFAAVEYAGAGEDCRACADGDYVLELLEC
jgi:hypothetical protein